MRELIVSKNDAGQRFDKFLFKYLSNANSSFVYKMLRKKNIVLNDKKSDGKNLLCEGDSIKIYMAEETIIKFSSNDMLVENSLNIDKQMLKMMPEVIYEDKNLLLINKPVGMLSQKAIESDISANEICLNYLISRQEVTIDSLKVFKPSICNRLDRNTSGILIFAKNYAMAKCLAGFLKDRTIHKYYKCLVKGRLDKNITLQGNLSKDENKNFVSINANAVNSVEILTNINTLLVMDKLSLVEVLLITGKTHQIRAHLASIGHPLLGDYKYGDRAFNDYYKKKYNISSQLLCSYKLIFPKIDDGDFAYLSEKVFEINLPDDFEKVMTDGNMEIKRS